MFFFAFVVRDRRGKSSVNIRKKKNNKQRAFVYINERDRLLVNLIVVIEYGDCVRIDRVSYTDKIRLGQARQST